MKTVSLTTSTDYTAQLADIDRQRRMAELMQAQGMKAPEAVTAGGYYVPASWTQGLAQALKQGLGAYQQNQITARQKEIAQRYGADESNALRSYDAQRVGQGQAPIQPATPMDDEGNAMPVAQGSSDYRAPDPEGAARAAIILGEKFPALGRIGALDYARQMKNQDLVHIKPDETVGRISPAGEFNPMYHGPSKPPVAPRVSQFKPGDIQNYQEGRDTVTREYQADGTWKELSRGEKDKPMQIHMPQPPVAVIGPDGKPVYVDRSQAVGKAPWAGTAEQSAAVAGGKVEGKSEASSKLALPQVEAEVKQTTDLVDALVKHPGKKFAVGLPSVAGTQFIPGTPGADFKTRLDQITGKQFLAAYETLKGGGQITEIEGKKATDAMSRMKSASSQKAFDEAADEYKATMQGVLTRARTRAANPARRASDKDGSVLDFNSLPK